MSGKTNRRMRLWTRVVNGIAMTLALGLSCLCTVAAGANELAAYVELPDPNHSPDPGLIWEILIGGFVVLTAFSAVIVWVLAALRDLKQTQLRRNIMIGRALNHVGQGVVMVDGLRQVVFINDSYLGLYGLERFDVPSGMSYADLLALRRRRGTLDVLDSVFYEKAGSPEGYIADLPDGRAILIKYSPLPNGGAIATHDDITTQRNLSRELADTKQFLETVLDNIPVSVTVKNISDGTYTYVNRHFENFSTFSREKVIGKTAEEVFSAETAAACLKFDNDVLAQEGARGETVILRGSERRTLAHVGVIARSDHDDRRFLIAMFEDVTERRALSHELEQTKIFLESIVDNIPVSVVAKTVDESRIIFVNRAYEKFTGFSREQMLGKCASEVFPAQIAAVVAQKDAATLVASGQRTEIVIDRGGGRSRTLGHVGMLVRNDHGDPSFVMSLFEDITARKALSRELESTKKFLESVVDNIPVGVIVKHAVDGRYLLINRAAEGILNHDRDLAIGRTSRDIYPEAHAHSIMSRDAEAVSLRDVVIEKDEINTNIGKRLFQTRYVTVMDEAGDPQYLIKSHEDISDQVSLSKQLAETKHFLETVVDNLPVGLIVKDAVDGRYLVVNRLGEIILNHPRDDAMGRTARDIYEPDIADWVISREVAASSSRGIFTEDCSVKTSDGFKLFQYRYVTVTDDAGKPQYLIKTHEDVTARRQTEARMAYMAYHDALTKLPNRPAFLKTLAEMIGACSKEGDRFAVLSLDLNGLQEVNDVFGQAVGDQLLIEASRRIEAQAGGSLVARLGGDEFGLIVDGVDADAARTLALKLSEAMSMEFKIDGKSVLTGITTGISVFPCDGTNAATLLANAGAALSRAKVKSRGSIGVFAPEMDQHIRNRRLLHQDLSSAIRNGELSLHYQPQARAVAIVDHADFTGFEALARWVHPTRGFVPPGDFIPLAEESGLIVEMGEWILRQACIEAASWPVPLQIAVNLSPAQFAHGDLVGLVHSILLETGLQASRLELEITEGVLIEDFERGLALLRRLKALGVRVSMDDFGSGYSSLTYLQAFPFDKIKIDRAFVMNLGQNLQSAAIVRAVIGLGHGLDVTIVAEGVETLDQLRFLADEGCDCVQGYYIGRPAPIEKYDALVGRAAPKIETQRMVG